MLKLNRVLLIPPFSSIFSFSLIPIQEGRKCMTLIIMTHQFATSAQVAEKYREDHSKYYFEKEEMKLLLTSFITAALSEIHHLEGIY